MVWKTFHGKGKVERRQLTQPEIEHFWKDLQDEECRIELLRQAYQGAVSVPEQIEILAQTQNLIPTKI